MRQVRGHQRFQWRRRLAGNLIARRFIEAGRVRHELTQGDRGAEALRYLEIEVIIDVAVQIEPADLDLLHERDPGEELRDRAELEERPLGGYRTLRLQIGVAITPCQHRSTLGDEDDGAAGNSLVGKRGLEETVGKAAPGSLTIAGR